MPSLEKTPKLAKQPSTISDTSEVYKEDVSTTRGQQDLGIIRESDLEGDDIDDNAKVLRGQRIDFTPEEEKRVLRRIDWRLMVIMALATGIQFVDKAALGNAAIYGLRQDLNLQGADYSLAVSLFYVGYAIGIFPSIYMMQKFHAGKFVGLMVIAWGVTMLGMLGCKDFTGLAILRVLLGFFESCLNPGFSLINTRWYTQKELPWRTALWTINNGLMPIPFLLIYYGIGHTSNPSLSPWRAIFLLLGLVTIITGILVYFFIPDSPVNARWLNDREKAIAVERVARAQTGLKNTTWKWKQCIEALTDIKVWLMITCLFAGAAGGTLNTNFLGLVIRGFGYSPLVSTLLQIPTFAIQTITSTLVLGLVTFVKPLRNCKQPILSIAALCVIAGCAILYTNSPTGSNGRLLLFALYLVAINNCSFAVLIAVVGNNVAGMTKKSTVQMMFYASYCVSSTVIPQAFLAREAPVYHTGILTILCFQCVLFFCYWACWLLMARDNRLRDKQFAQLSQEQRYQQQSIAGQVLQGLQDLTDKTNPTFRYSG